MHGSRSGPMQGQEEADAEAEEEKKYDVEITAVQHGGESKDVARMAMLTW